MKQNSFSNASNILNLSVRDMLTTLAFIAGNIVFPQLCHLVPGGGPTWLPIYFFTLVGAWHCGLKAGLLISILSPIVNCLCFGMPSTAALAPILLKSVLLAGAAAFVASRYAKPTLLLILSVVLTYQVAGTLGEWAICGDFASATQDFRMGVPGMLLQIVGGYLVLRTLARK